MSERDIFEVANQLHGEIGPNTEKGLAEFLWREGNEAAKLAEEILHLRSEVERLTEGLALGIKTQGELVLLVQNLTRELNKARLRVAAKKAESSA